MLYDPVSYPGGETAQQSRYRWNPRQLLLQCVFCCCNWAWQSSHTRSQWRCKCQISPARRRSWVWWCAGLHTHQAPSPGQLSTLSRINQKADMVLMTNKLLLNNIRVFYHVRDPVSIFLQHPPAARKRTVRRTGFHPGRRPWCWSWCQTNTSPPCPPWAEARCRSGRSHGCAAWWCLSRVGYLSDTESRGHNQSGLKGYFGISELVGWGARLATRDDQFCPSMEKQLRVLSAAGGYEEEEEITTRKPVLLKMLAL